MQSVLFDAAGHRRSPVTMPGFTRVVLRETRASGIPPTRPQLRRSSRRCARQWHRWRSVAGAGRECYGGPGCESVKLAAMTAVRPPSPPSSSTTYITQLSEPLVRSPPPSPTWRGHTLTTMRPPPPGGTAGRFTLIKHCFRGYNLRVMDHDLASIHRLRRRRERLRVIWGGGAR
jgi:hypothetical protein